MLKNQYPKYSQSWYIYGWYLRNRLNIVVQGILLIVVCLSITLLSYHSRDIDVPSMDVPYIEVSVQAPPIEPPVLETPVVEVPVYVSPYTEEDVILMASILQAECWEGDWRKEATVIVNRLEYGSSFYNPDGTLKGVIEARDGSQFNGSRSESYKNREYTQQAYDAAYDVLINGYRAFSEDVIYFANVHTATDTNFINSVKWIEKQQSSRSHSFGVDL